MKSNSNRIKKNILPPIILLLLLIVLFTLILESIYTSNSNQNKENLIVNAELIEKSLQLTYTESFDIKKLGPSYLFNNDSSNLFPQQYKIALTPYLNESEVAVFSQTRRTITYQKPIQLNNRSYELSITTKNPFTLIGGRLYLLIFTLFLIIAHGFGMLVMNMRLSKLDEIERALFKKNEAYQVINAKLSNSNIRLSETINELHDAKAKAEESNRLNSAFLANISHEIRTP
ncbi:MAG: hypothetical protein PF541_12695, partial [Prolixibacteraceae bacterium]|nr:hypothetical protein [Prolixibacteraceae bacterium]